MARILLTEDDDAVRAFVQRALQIDNHEVLVACDGAEAMEILTKEEGRFDLLLSDVKMPVMDGIALALNTARTWPDLTILLMTGYADQRERAHGLDLLVHDIVTKPFSLADIRKAVGEAVAAPTPDRQVDAPMAAQR